MNRTDRLTGITLALQAGPRTAASLAARFEVSRRTILRDIDALCQIGVPVIAVPGPNGGYRLPDEYSLPPLHFTAEEATAVLFALAHLGDAERSPLGRPRETAEQKIRSTLRPDVLSKSRDDLAELSVSPAANEPEAGIVARLRRAVRETGWLTITYHSLRGDSQRVIQPRSVYVAGGRWYTSAIDAKHAEQRMFRVDRISAATPTAPPADAAAIIRRATTETRPYDDLSYPEIRVRLDRRAARLAREHPDLRHHLGATKDDSNVSLSFRCPPHELPYYAREIARFGTGATILAPDSLRELVIADARTLLDHHAGALSAERVPIGDRTMSPTAHYAGESSGVASDRSAQRADGTCPRRARHDE
ncbi:MAG: YafY family transcriptional regulator [Chloroflexota bacterium]|nr:YafY family transcriptional regulator [Chloroflexota bacterium]